MVVIEKIFNVEFLEFFNNVFFLKIDHPIHFKPIKAGLGWFGFV